MHQTRLKRHFLNIEQTQTCSSFGDRTRTPYFLLWKISSIIVRPITINFQDWFLSIFLLKVFWTERKSRMFVTQISWYLWDSSAFLTPILPRHTHIRGRSKFFCIPCVGLFLGLPISQSKSRSKYTLHFSTEFNKTTFTIHHSVRHSKR